MILSEPVAGSTRSGRPKRDPGCKILATRCAAAFCCLVMVGLLLGAFDHSAQAARQFPEHSGVVIWRTLGVGVHLHGTPWRLGAVLGCSAESQELAADRR